ncbi:acyl-CoA desaturase, partial [Streptomyces sp. SID10244]|nr:acyl-CoA desaturase [Streptomyces sp. SID10244]
AGFEYGVAAQHLELGKKRKTPEAKEQFRRDLADVGKKVGRQVVKDYAVYPALVAGATGRSVGVGHAFRKALTANLMGNFIRN